MTPDPQTGSIPQTVKPIALWSWALYDWANSAFFTIILTFVFARYFPQGVIDDEVAGTFNMRTILLFLLAGFLLMLTVPHMKRDEPHRPG